MGGRSSCPAFFMYIEVQLLRFGEALEKDRARMAGPKRAGGMEKQEEIKGKACANYHRLRYNVNINNAAFFQQEKQQEAVVVLKIKTKLLAGSVVLIILIGIVASLGIHGFMVLKEQYQSIITDDHVTIVNLREIQYYFTGQANDERGFLLTGKPEFRQEIDEKSEQIKQRLAVVGKLIETDKEKQLLKEIDESHTRFTQINYAVIDLYAAGNLDEAGRLSFGDGRSTRKQLEASFNELVEINNEMTKAKNSAAAERAGLLMSLMLALSAAAIVTGVVVGLITARNIIRPISALQRELNTLAHSGGDLRRQIDIANQDEIGDLALAVNQFLAELRGILLQVRSCSEDMAASTQQLYANADESAQAANQVSEVIGQVASGAETQANAISSTASIVQRISATIEADALKAGEIALLTDKTASAAKNGGEAIEKAVRQMTDVSEVVTNSAAMVTQLGQRSQEIGQIVGLIAGIAGQTNLLALNAAIEAARAGEQGRGFAVVAEEVRKLAEQSQDAAKQIAGLIGEIQQDTKQAVVSINEGNRVVRAGTEVVHQAGQSFEEIVALIGQVAGEIRKMAENLQHTCGESTQIVSSVQAIHQISQDTAAQTQTVSAATQEQSAAAEEIASASQALARLAEQLANAVNKFHV